MFYECNSLESIEFSNFKAYIRQVNHLFRYCYKLKSIDLSGIKGASIGLESMFGYCYSLTSIDFSSFDDVDNNTYQSVPKSGGVIKVKKTLVDRIRNLLPNWEIIPVE